MGYCGKCIRAPRWGAICIKVERDKTFGDVLVTTLEGWGVMVLFNEAARIREGDVVWE